VHRSMDLILARTGAHKVILLIMVCLGSASPLMEADAPTSAIACQYRYCSLMGQGRLLAISAWQCPRSEVQARTAQIPDLCKPI
jgi:hypothetical protein